MTNFSRYNALLIAAFPELKKSLSEREGIHLKTHCLADSANEAIALEDWAKLQRYYEFINRVLTEKPDDEVFNAVCVSFIEHLDFHADTRKGAYAKNLLPPILLTEWKSLEAYWRNQSTEVKTK